MESALLNVFVARVQDRAKILVGNIETDLILFKFVEEFLFIFAQVRSLCRHGTQVDRLSVGHYLFAEHGNEAWKVWTFITVVPPKPTRVIQIKGCLEKLRDKAFIVATRKWKLLGGPLNQSELFRCVLGLQNIILSDISVELPSKALTRRYPNL